LNRHGHIDRYGESDRVTVPASACDHGVDPNQLALRVDQRATGMTPIDLCVDLEIVLERLVSDLRLVSSRRCTC
jgi:hypothetical protein